MSSSVGSFDIEPNFIFFVLFVLDKLLKPSCLKIGLIVSGKLIESNFFLFGIIIAFKESKVGLE